VGGRLSTFGGIHSNLKLGMAKLGGEKKTCLLSTSGGQGFIGDVKNCGGYVSCTSSKKGY